jgi:hypothetical protein
MTPITKSEAVRLINLMPGMTAKLSGAGSEISVRAKGRKKAYTYTTDDPQDAPNVANARQMSRSEPVEH